METDRTTVPHRLAAAVAIALALVWPGCGGDSGTQPSATNALSITAATPASGANITIPSKYPYNFFGGVLVPPGSGIFSVTVTMQVAQDVPWARLGVWLLRNGSTNDWCGENGPDSPTWQFLTKGWNASFTVTGFRLAPLPCDVTGIRAVLHQANNGLAGPPIASQTIAEAVMQTKFHIEY